MTLGALESLVDTTVHPPVAGRADQGGLEAGLMKETWVKTVRKKTGGAGEEAAAEKGRG